ncbi:hypothetical protein [Caenibius sp. WL]|uniref:hypothetical protein n=1 Tax=Caenibius sp. WL TaxID=2872646 RepID=UPI001C99FF33|nr:hypothetical protein [Caenibius sp. WL]QZP07809.1 hypothetical protein K5X80_14320 [Caenibius sp. WL]QZP09959.1 hypothetical protein K5X80_16885 [Caenibius sp. WL]
MTKADLIALAERCEALRGYSNEIDVLAELALFKPDDDYVSVRANHAGTKVVYTTASGHDQTYWAPDHTISNAARQKTSASLRAIAEEMDG